MITIQIGEMPDRFRHWASCGEHHVVRGNADPAFALARVLVAAGYDPKEPLEVSRGNKVSLRYKTLGEAAGLMTAESDTDDIRIRKYRSPPSVAPGVGREKAGPDGEE